VHHRRARLSLIETRCGKPFPAYGTLLVSRSGEAASELAAINGIELVYELPGSPVSLSRRWAEPLIAQTIVAEHYRLLRHHRVGFGGSSRLPASGVWLRSSSRPPPT
jgi:hypothetical protein